MNVMKQAKKEYKTMQNPINDQIAKTEAFIEKLKVADVQGFVIATGEHRVCVNVEEGCAVGILKAPVYDTREAAEQYAKQVYNGNGEQGEVYEKARLVNWEIMEQEKLLEILKKYA